MGIMRRQRSYRLFLASFLIVVGRAFCQNCGEQTAGLPGSGAWQWTVAIMKTQDDGTVGLRCSGFLIDTRHVLSAAQCFQFGESAKDFTARIRHVDASKGDSYCISNITVHEEYVKNLFYNDIALLTLSRDVDASDFRPICLPQSLAHQNLTGKEVTGVGFGVINKDGKKEVSLQKGKRSVISNYQCNEQYNEFTATFPSGITKKIICTMNGVPICHGSSGGPLMFEDQGRWFAVGLTSFVQSCNRSTYPEGYTRVSEYLNWIEDNRLTTRDSLSSVYRFPSIESVYEFEVEKLAIGPN